MIPFFYWLVPEILGCPKKFDIFIENQSALLYIYCFVKTHVINLTLSTIYIKICVINLTRSAVSVNTLVKIFTLSRVSVKNYVINITLSTLSVRTRVIGLTLSTISVKTCYDKSHPLYNISTNLCNKSPSLYNIC